MREITPALIMTTAVWENRGAIVRFRRALRRCDQIVLDQILKDVFMPFEPMPSGDMPVETALLYIILEQQKELLAIREGLRDLIEPNIGDG